MIGWGMAHDHRICGPDITTQPSPADVLNYPRRDVRVPETSLSQGALPGLRITSGSSWFAGDCDIGFCQLIRPTDIIITGPNPLSIETFDSNANIRTWPCGRWLGVDWFTIGT